MVRKCIVCKKSWNHIEDRSFHRFPKQHVRRQTWMQNLCVTENDVLQSKDALVCSDHFKLNDMYCNARGHFFLKFNAVPIKSYSAEVKGEVEQYEDTNLISEAEDDVENFQDIHLKFEAESVVLQFENDVKTETDDDIQEFEDKQLKTEVSLNSINKNNGIVIDSDIDNNSTASENSSISINSFSSSTLTASSEEFNNKGIPFKQRKFVKPRYIGDCHLSDMSCPARAKANWQMAKKTIKNQRRKISLLQLQNLRLRNKITSLNSQIAQLKKNQ